ncbi:MAG: hypothetical protein EOP47_29545, partial [Sphingobacteriaceae bacterium]
MKKLFTLLIITILATASVVAQKLGSISGTVTSEGKPAAMVSVALVGTKHGAVTDDEGRYRINRVKPGTYLRETL